MTGEFSAQLQLQSTLVSSIAFAHQARCQWRLDCFCFTPGLLKRTLSSYFMGRSTPLRRRETEELHLLEALLLSPFLLPMFLLLLKTFCYVSLQLMILLPQSLECENYTYIPPSWLLFNITQVLALILWQDSVVGRGLVRLCKHSRMKTEGIACWEENKKLKHTPVRETLNSNAATDTPLN